LTQQIAVAARPPVLGVALAFRRRIRPARLAPLDRVDGIVLSVAELFSFAEPHEGLACVK
jgi:hypothetical protein